MPYPFKINIKLFAAEDTFGPADFLPVFHRWIQEHALPGHLLIDVADYAHVPDGPGTLVVASEANVHMDRTGGRLGMTYVRKRPIDGAANLDQTLDGVFAAALAAGRLLEGDPALGGRLRFRTDEISVQFNDRLLAPNTTAAAETMALDLLSPAERALGRRVTVRVQPTSPRALLELRVIPV
jgi:hypothetical protein